MNFIQCGGGSANFLSDAATGRRFFAYLHGRLVGPVPQLHPLAAAVRHALPDVVAGAAQPCSPRGGRSRATAMRNEQVQHVIPPITNRLGIHWHQPNPRRILVTDTHAVMTREDFLKLAEYSSSYPSGVYDGKMWKTHMHDCRWQLRWYGPHESDPKLCTINARSIEIVWLCPTMDSVQ